MVILMVENSFDLKGIDYKIAREVVNAFEILFEKYPRLENKINYVSSFQNVYDEIERACKCLLNVYCKAKIIDVLNKLNKTFAFSYNMPNENDLNPYFYYNYPSQVKVIVRKPVFQAIAINESWSYETFYYKLTQNHALNRTYPIDIKGIIYHEIGHIFSNIFYLLDDKYFMNKVFMLMNRRDINYSLYSLRNPDEFIAEHFALYMIGNNNEASKFIGDYITKLYNFYENTTVFDYDDKYQTLVRKIIV